MQAAWMQDAWKDILTAPGSRACTDVPGTPQCSLQRLLDAAEWRLVLSHPSELIAHQKGLPAYDPHFTLLLSHFDDGDLHVRTPYLPRERDKV